MKRITVIIIGLIAFTIHATAQENSVNEQSEAIEKRIPLLERENERLQVIIDRQHESISTLEENFKGQIQTTKSELKKEIESLDTKYGYYLLFGGILITLIGFFINFLGRQLIKERVESLIQRDAIQYAQKVTDQVIKSYLADGKIEEAIEHNGQPAIEKIIKKLEREGFMAIDGIKTKGNEVISSMLASYSSIKRTKGSYSDESITELNQSSRANEYFELAMSSKDALVQISLYEKVLEIEPNNPQALNNLGVSYNNAYNYPKAIDVFQKSIKIAPNFALLYANMANSYNLLNQLDEALKLANQAIQIDPTVDYTYSVKGNILTKKGELQEAEKTFNKAIALNPKSPEAYFTRGFFYEQTKQFEKSEKDYFRSESLGFPNKAMLYNNLAVMHRRMKDFDTAITYINKARKENPDLANLDGTLALIYADKKDKDNFYKHLVIALDKGCPAWIYLDDPGFDDYRNDTKLKDLLDSYKKKSIAQ